MVSILEETKPMRPARLQENDWNDLLKQISKGKCTPFIGPEAAKGLYLTKQERAQSWAAEEDYPLDDQTELARVAEFLTVQYSESRPIEKLIEEFEAVEPPDFNAPHEPHRVLADLPLPIYITTNYDDFMFQALSNRVMRRDPKREYCRWRKRMQDTATLLSGDYRPTVASPVVFHLYGHTEAPLSIVLTENDYLKFLANTSRELMRIPPLIQGAIAGGSLLFLGYRLDEWDFRILLHTIANYLNNSLARAHISVQLVPVGEKATEEQKEKATRYLNRYFEMRTIKVYWGSCQDFVEELSERWRDSDYGKQRQ